MFLSAFGRARDANSAHSFICRRSGSGIKHVVAVDGEHALIARNTTGRTSDQ